METPSTPGRTAVRSQLTVIVPSAFSEAVHTCGAGPGSTGGSTGAAADVQSISAFSCCTNRIEYWLPAGTVAVGVSLIVAKNELAFAGPVRTAQRTSPSSPQSKVSVPSPLSVAVHDASTAPAAESGTITTSAAINARTFAAISTRMRENLAIVSPPSVRNRTDTHRLNHQQ